jgi:hypothetical protein
LAVPIFLNTIEQTALSTWLRESESVFGLYFILVLHTIGLALVVGGNVVIDLRLLGVVPETPLAPLKQLFPIMWVGFGINAFSGTLLLIAYPTKQLTNPVFYLKLTLIGLAIWVMVRIKNRVFDDASLSQDAMIAAGRTMAKWSLILWAGAITAGRLLAYTYQYLQYGLRG